MCSRAQGVEAGAAMAGNMWHRVALPQWFHEVFLHRDVGAAEAETPSRIQHRVVMEVKALAQASRRAHMDVEVEATEKMRYHVATKTATAAHQKSCRAHMDVEVATEKMWYHVATKTATASHQRNCRVHMDVEVEATEKLWYHAV